MIPKHVAIIVDGNRRWARTQNMPVLAGHRRVVKKILRPLTLHAKKLGIKHLTFWVFSTENWQRDKREVQGLLKILGGVLKTKVEEANKEGIRLNIIGDISALPQDLKEGLKRGMMATAKNKEMTVSFGLNYGGRDEIIRTIKKIRNSKFEIRNLTEEKFNQFLDTAGIPDPDLIIRTGGEMRLSGFMSWQSAYSELYFTNTLMPDFTLEEFDKAISDLQKRERRFGR